MLIYMPSLDVVFVSPAPFLANWLLAHGGIEDPPYREGGYRIASAGLERRMKNALWGS